jgi:hypothetical protein
LNYIKIYNSLVSNKADRRKGKDVYYESHHIIPKSLGGDNDKSNLVLLTAREHFVAHRLLTKIYPNSWGMKFALFMMAQEGTKGAKDLPINSSTYERIRIDLVETRRKLAIVPDSLEFDNNIKLIPRVTSKLRSKWRWRAAIKSAIGVIVCNGIVAYEQGIPVSYKRKITAYKSGEGRCTSANLLKAIDMLSEMGYLEDLRSDPDLPVAKIKLSVYKLTDEGYRRFTGLGEKI